MSVFKTAAIFAKSSPDLKGPLEALAALVTQSGVSLLVDETASQILADPVRFPPNSVQTIGEKADVAIVLGGDGTTLGIGRAPGSVRLPDNRHQCRTPWLHHRRCA